MEEEEVLSRGQTYRLSDTGNRATPTFVNQLFGWFSVLSMSDPLLRDISLLMRFDCFELDFIIEAVRKPSKGAAPATLNDIPF